VGFTIESMTQTARATGDDEVIREDCRKICGEHPGCAGFNYMRMDHPRRAWRGWCAFRWAIADPDFKGNEDSKRECWAKTDKEYKPHVTDPANSTEPLAVGAGGSSQQSSAQASTVIVTMVTNLNAESTRFFNSVAKFEPSATVWVASTSAVAPKIKKTFPHLKIKARTVLDKYQGPSAKYRTWLEEHNLWTPLQMEKAKILRAALKEEGVLNGAWYLDGDTVLFGRLPRVDAKFAVGVSKQGISWRHELEYGVYNGGCVFVRNTTVLDVWEEVFPFEKKRPCCKDQTSLEKVAAAFKDSAVELGCGTNVGWWRFSASTQVPAKTTYRKLQCMHGKIMHEGCNEEINSMHYHVADYEGAPLRPYVERMLRDCKHPALDLVRSSYMSQR